MRVIAVHGRWAITEVEQGGVGVVDLESDVLDVIFAAQQRGQIITDRVTVLTSVDQDMRG